MSKELKFASKTEAMQHLADITGKKIKVAAFQQLDPLELVNHLGKFPEQFNAPLMQLKKNAAKAQDEVKRHQEVYVTLNEDELRKDAKIIIERNLEKPLNSIVEVAQLLLKNIEI